MEHRFRFLGTMIQNLAFPGSSQALACAQKNESASTGDQSSVALGTDIASNVGPKTEALVVPVINEEVTLSKQVEQTGAVRLHKVIHEDAVSINEALRRDVALVKEVWLNKEVDQLPAVRQEGDVTIVPVMEERLVLRKQRVLVKEIHISVQKQLARDVREVPVKREEVIVERVKVAGAKNSPAAPAANALENASADPSTAENRESENSESVMHPGQGPPHAER